MVKNDLFPRRLSMKQFIEIKLEKQAYAVRPLVSVPKGVKSVAVAQHDSHDTILGRIG
jgi:hypothetical protein